MNAWLDKNRPWLDRARAEWSPEAVEPFRVRVWFSSPVAWSRDGIQLDGYLQRLVVERTTGEAADDIFAEAPRGTDADITIPVHHVSMGGHMIACASWGWPPDITFESLRWRRHRTRVDVLGLDKVVVAGGAYKSTNIPLQTLTTPWLDFYLIGDRAKVTNLLSDAVGIGRGYSAGYGTILGIEYAPDPEERALVWNRRPMRSLPLGEGCPELDPTLMDEKPTRAPYWAARNLALCALPHLQISA